MCMRYYLIPPIHNCTLQYLVFLNLLLKESIYHWCLLQKSVVFCNDKLKDSKIRRKCIDHITCCDIDYNNSRQLSVITKTKKTRAFAFWFNWIRFKVIRNLFQVQPATQFLFLNEWSNFIVSTNLCDFIPLWQTIKIFSVIV